MKTIEIEDEMYDALMELSKEMTTQDMLGTQMPHLFQVRQMKEVPAYEGNGDRIVWLGYDRDVIDEDELQKLIKKEFKLKGSYKDVKLSGWQADSETEEWLKENGYSSYDVSDEMEFSNSFFTAKACQSHIDLNHYHYTEPIVYLNSSWRNPEMEMVSEFLCNLTGKTNHK